MGGPPGHVRQRPGFVRRVDDAVLPEIDRLAQRAGRWLGTPFRAATRREQDLFGGRLARSLWRHRQELLLVAALLAFAGSYLHLERYPDLRRQVAARAGADPAEVGEPDPVPLLRADTVVVGPAPGAHIAHHVRERQATLAAAEDDVRRVAVVSLTAYSTADELAALLPAGVAAYEVLARAPGREQPARLIAVDGPLAATVHEAVRAERRRIAAEEAALRAQLEAGTVTGAGADHDAQAQVDRLAATRNLLDAGAGIVYAVVVEAPVATLRQLATHAAVRLVDLAPTGTEAGQVRAVGLLPDDTATVSPAAPTP